MTPEQKQEYIKRLHERQEKDRKENEQLFRDIAQSRRRMERRQKLEDIILYAFFFILCAVTMFLLIHYGVTQ